MATGEFIPYSGKDLPGNGLVAEVVVAAAHTQDLEPTLGFFPWARCEARVLAGTDFAAFPYAITAERQKSFLFSDALVLTRARIYYRTSQPKVKSWSTLADFRATTFAAVRGYWYVEALAKAGIPVVECDTLATAIRALEAGRIDFVIENEVVMAAVLDALPASQSTLFSALEKPYESLTLHLMVSKSYPQSQELLRRFNLGLKTITENGSYSEIIRRYGLDG